MAAELERAHLLWFDEPCPLSNLAAAYRIAAESVTPVGLGRYAVEAGVFQDLLRSDAIDVIRADIALHGITRIRRIAALAVVDCIFVGVAQRDYTETLHALERTRDAVHVLGSNTPRNFAKSLRFA